MNMFYLLGKKLLRFHFVALCSRQMDITHQQFCCSPLLKDVCPPTILCIPGLPHNLSLSLHVTRLICPNPLKFIALWMAFPIGKLKAD